jgi:hypothetical protein
MLLFAFVLHDFLVNCQNEIERDMQVTTTSHNTENISLHKMIIWVIILSESGLCL